MSSDISTVHCGLNSASPAYVHEHLLREHSNKLADLIDGAEQTGEDDVAITIGLVDSAMHKWCIWLYGQPLDKQGDDPSRAAVDLCRIHQFSMDMGDHGCANACVDALREMLTRDHATLDDDLGTLLDFLGQEQQAVRMLVDMLVYGPCARSGKTQEWMTKTKVEERWVHFFYQLGMTFATRFADEALGNDDPRPNIMGTHAYHIGDTASGACCGLAADTVGDVSSPTI